MRVPGDLDSPTPTREKLRGTKVTHLKRRGFLGLAVVALLGIGIQPAGAAVMAPSGVQIISLPNLAPSGQEGSQFTYTFNQASGPLARDFDDANRGGITTAQYIFSGTLNDGQGTHVSAQWSPTVNATGGFVGFLGNNASGVETDTPVNPTKVADVRDSNGNVYGEIFASKTATDDNTKFTFVNTSHFTIDPSITGEALGASAQENFIGGVTVNTTTPSGATLMHGDALTTPTGFTVPAIVAAAAGQPIGVPIDLNLTAAQQFIATTDTAPVSISLSGGSIVVSDIATGVGGSGFIQVTGTILDSTQSVIQTVSLPTVFFDSTSTDFSQGPFTMPFGDETMNGGTNLTIGDTFTLQVSYDLFFTPLDATASVMADPDISLTFTAPPLGVSPSAVPEPATLVLAMLGAGCLGLVRWRRAWRGGPTPALPAEAQERADPS